MRELIQMLSLYQMHVHLRCLYCYEEDAQTIKHAYAPELEFPLPEAERHYNKSITLFISAVIGNTLLSSAYFIAGTENAILDLYDTWVVTVKIKETEIAIPAARILLAPPPPRSTGDVETAFELLMAPKGSSNQGKPYLSWWCWIPCGEDTWLEVRTTNMQILGERQGKVSSSEQVTKHLASGDFYISFSEVSQLVKNCQVLENGI